MLNKTELGRYSVESEGIEDAQCNLKGLSDVIVCMSIEPGSDPSAETMRSALYFLARAVEHESKRLSQLVAESK